jgi:microcin C transport system ATP-binding protein
MESPLVSARELHIGFRRGQRIDEVVHGIDLDIHKNETLALVGESGSGKTVSAQAILRLFPESIIAYPRGQIRFAGRDCPWTKSN